MKAVEKEFSLSFDELRFTVGNVITSMVRDETEFIARGVTVANRDAFEAEGDAFEVFPPDDYFQADITLEVEAKNAARENSTKMIRKVSGYVQQQWGLQSPQYKKLGIKDYLRKSEKAFITIARQAALTAEGYLSDLTPIGLTQQQIDDLRAEAQLMEDKLHAVFSATEVRDSKTQERLELANALFNNLRKYCDIGKLIWEDVDEAKYNDYIIYKTTASSLPKVQNLTLEVNPIDNSIVDLHWNPVVGATEYELYSSEVASGQSAGEFSLNNTFTTNTGSSIIGPGLRYYYKVRAKNATQQGAFSDEVWVEL